MKVRRADNFSFDSTDNDAYWALERARSFEAVLNDDEDAESSSVLKQEGSMVDGEENNGQYDEDDYFNSSQEASFECVLDTDRIGGDDDESIPPPPPQAGSNGSNWSKLRSLFRPSHRDEADSEEAPLDEDDREEVPLDEGHGGAIVLETSEWVEASDGRAMANDMTLVSGKQARVTLIPDTTGGVLYNDRIVYSDNLERSYDRRRRKRKLSLLMLACLLLALTIAVLVLGVQGSRQDDAERGGSTAAAMTGEQPQSSSEETDANDHMQDQMSEGRTESAPTPVPSSSPSPTACVASVEALSGCYPVGSDITVLFRNCDPQIDDWVGLYEVLPDLDPNGLGEPLDWLWTCGSQLCVGKPTAGELYYSVLSHSLAPGSYKPFLCNREPFGPPYSSFASGAAFQVSADCT